MHQDCEGSLDRHAGLARAYQLRILEQATGEECSAELDALVDTAAQNGWPAVELAALTARSRGKLVLGEDGSWVWPTELQAKVAEAGRPTVDAQLKLLEVMAGLPYGGTASLVDDIIDAWTLLLEPGEYELDRLFGFVNLGHALAGAGLWSLATEVFDRTWEANKSATDAGVVGPALLYCRAEALLGEVLALVRQQDPSATTALRRAAPRIAEAQDGLDLPVWRDEIEGLHLVARALVEASDIPAGTAATLIARLRAANSAEIARLVGFATPLATWPADVKDQLITPGRFEVSLHSVRLRGLERGGASGRTIRQAFTAYERVLGRFVIDSTNSVTSAVRAAIESRTLDLEHQRLKRDVRTDQLTGVGNRRAFDGRLDDLAEQVMTVLMVDIDLFKVINDTYGHQVGDQAICAVAAALQAAGRDGGSDRSAEVFRLGGDEFAVILPPATDAQIASYEAGIVRFLETTDWSWGATTYAPKVSVGCATGRPGPDLAAEADANMYASRAAGRAPAALPEPHTPPLDRRRRGAATVRPCGAPEPTPAEVKVHDQAMAEAYQLCLRGQTADPTIEAEIDAALTSAQRHGWPDVVGSLKYARFELEIFREPEDVEQLCIDFLSEAAASGLPGYEAVARFSYAEHLFGLGRIPEYLHQMTTGSALLRAPDVHPYQRRSGFIRQTIGFACAGLDGLTHQASVEAERLVTEMTLSVEDDAVGASAAVHVNRVLTAVDQGLVHHAVGDDDKARALLENTTHDVAAAVAASAPETWVLTARTLCWILQLVLDDEDADPETSRSVKVELEAAFEPQVDGLVDLVTPGALDDGLPDIWNSTNRLEDSAVMYLVTRGIERAGRPMAEQLDAHGRYTQFLTEQARRGRSMMADAITSGLDVRRQAAERDRLRTQSNTDPLTGLLNRRGFEEWMATLNGDEVSLAIIDVDDLKVVNDTHGHLAGDQHLQTVGLELQLVAPEESMLARIGGDEFAVLVRGRHPFLGLGASTTAPEDHLGHNLTRTLRDALATRTADNSDVTVPSVTAGVAWGTCGRQLLADADADLYRGKLLKRNTAPREPLTR